MFSAAASTVRFPVPVADSAERPRPSERLPSKCVVSRVAKRSGSRDVVVFTYCAAIHSIRFWVLRSGGGSAITSVPRGSKKADRSASFTSCSCVRLLGNSASQRVSLARLTRSVNFTFSSSPTILSSGLPWSLTSKSSICSTDMVLDAIAGQAIPQRSISVAHLRIPLLFLMPRDNYRCFPTATAVDQRGTEG